LQWGEINFTIHCLFKIYHSLYDRRFEVERDLLTLGEAKWTYVFVLCNNDDLIHIMSRREYGWKSGKEKWTILFSSPE